MSQNNDLLKNGKIVKVSQENQMKFACKLERNEATIDNLKLGMKEMFIVP